MSYYEQFMQSLGDLGTGLGAAAGTLAAGELVLKPALEKQAKRKQLDQAVFTGNFPLAAKLAHELGLADPTWDYQTAERDIPQANPTPPPLGKAATLPNAPNLLGPQVPEPTAPSPLSEGFFAGAMRGQNLGNPLGLKGTRQALFSQSLVPGQTAVVTEDKKTLVEGEVPRTIENPYGRDFKRTVTFKPQEAAAVDPAAALAAAPTRVYDFTPLKEVYKTDTLANTPENQRRLMGLYGGKQPEAELKQGVDHGQYLIKPGFGFTPTSVTQVLKGGMSPEDEGALKLKEAALKLEAATTQSELGLKKRGQDVDLMIANLRESRSGSGRGGSDDLSGKDAIKMTQAIFDDADRFAKTKELELRSNKLIGIEMAMDPAKAAQYKRGITQETEKFIRSRAAATLDPRIIGAVEVYLRNQGASPAPAGGPSPAAGPAPAVTPAPGAPVATPAAPKPRPRPQPTPTPRPRKPVDKSKSNDLLGDYGS